MIIIGQKWEGLVKTYMIKRCVESFGNSAVCGTIVILLIEVIVRIVTGVEDFIPFAPEYVALFPSESIAVGVNTLLYGVIGATFSAMIFIYEIDRIGFVIQNILYCIFTGIVWLPIVTLIWQLQKYPKAFWGTIIGFVCTYVIMSIVGYQITKKDVEQINLVLKEKK